MSNPPKDDPAEQTYPGFALPAQSYAAPPIRRPPTGRVLGRWAAGIAVVAAALGGVAVVVTKPVAIYACPPKCGRPPNGAPVMALPRFTPQDGSFSVSYPEPGSAYEVTAAQNGVVARFTGGDGGVLQLFGEPARGRSAKDVVRDVIRRGHPDATVAYEIPNAMVGYRLGFGEVADEWPQSTTGGYARTRVLVMAAVKDDIALIASATGPYHAFGPGFGPGPPSGANLQIAQDMGKYVNSFTWPGDSVR